MPRMVWVFKWSSHQQKHYLLSSLHSGGEQLLVNTTALSPPFVTGEAFQIQDYKTALFVAVQRQRSRSQAPGHQRHLHIYHKRASVRVGSSVLTSCATNNTILSMAPSYGKAALSGTSGDLWEDNSITRAILGCLETTLLLLVTP